MGLFIIEGIDGSGKSTQVEMLEQRLREDGYNTLKLKFPNYDDRSSGPIKMYLEGELGSDPDETNPHAASSFYAVDRFVSYKKSLENDYKSCTCIISDRYVVSNIIHQSSKIQKDKRKEFFEWLYDFEYGKMGIPIPDLTFYLDVPPEISIKYVESRNNGNESKKDIHEKDMEYLKRCYEAGLSSCDYLHIQKIECVRNGKLRPKEEINDILYYEIKKVLSE